MGRSRRLLTTRRRTMTLEALEERIVLDASVADTQDKQASQEVLSATPPQSGSAGESVPGSGASGQSPGGAAAPQQTADPLSQVYGQPLNEVLITNALDKVVPTAGSTSEAGDAGLRVVAVSSSVADAEILKTAVKDNVISLVFDGGTNSLDALTAQIAASLGGQKAESIALAVHDVGDGTFKLAGGFNVSLETISSDPHLQNFWKALGGMLTDNGRIDIMACNLAGTESGKLLVTRIEQLSGHSVAASDDPTGNAAYGGDWILESGDVDLAATYFVQGRLDQFDGRLVAIDLTGKTGWTTLMTGGNFDPKQDQQAQKATTDLIGDTTHGLLYTMYDDKGTSSTDDDEIAYRIRVGGPDSGGTFSSVMIMGIDADLNGDIDLYITLQDVQNGIQLWNPGTGANTGPSTTTTEFAGREFSLANNYSFVAVSSSTDIDWKTGDTGDLNLDGKTDYFVSFKLPFSAIQGELAELNHAGNPAAGIHITNESPLRYILGTSTQTNAFNSDLGGVDGKTVPLNTRLTWEELGAFSPIVSACNAFPVFDGGDTYTRTIYTDPVTNQLNSLLVVDANATDPNMDTLTYSIDGGSDASLFTINPSTGALSFISSHSYVAGGDNTYEVRIKVDDGHGGYDHQDVVVNILQGSAVPDTTPPQLTSLGPYDGETLIYLNRTVVFTFNEDIKWTGEAGTIFFESSTGKPADNITITLSGSNSSQAYIAGNSLIVDPAGTFKNASTTYTVHFSANTAGKFLIEDSAGNDWSQLTPTTTFLSTDTPYSYGLTGVVTSGYQFITTSGNVQDNTKPSVTGSPQDAPTTSFVPLDTDITVTFDENVVPNYLATTQKFHLFRWQGPGDTNPIEIESFLSTSTRVTFSGNQATLNPTANLVPNQHYYVTVDADAVRDLAGNTSNVQSSTTMIDFYTTDKPYVESVTSYTPNGTWTTHDDIYVVVHFSEVVNVTGNPQLTMDLDGTDRVATYYGGTGTRDLVFHYEVQANDSTLSNTSYLYLNYVPEVGGTSTALRVSATDTIKDVDGNSAVKITESNPTYDYVVLPAYNATNALYAPSEALIIDAQPENTVPTVALSTPESNVLPFTGAGKVFSISDSDAAATDLMQVTLKAQNGTLTMSTLTGLNFTFSDTNGAGVGDGTADSTMTFRGTIGNVNAALATLSYSPTPGWSGTASIEIATWDQRYRGADSDPNSGKPKIQDVDSVTVTVTPADSTDPQAYDDYFQLNEDPVITYGVAPNILYEPGFEGDVKVANSYGIYTGTADVPGLDSPFSYAVTGGPEHGTVWLSYSTGVFKYTPEANWNGTDYFYYTITDSDGETSTAKVTLFVMPVEDAPDAQPIVKYAPVNTVITFAAGDWTVTDPEDGPTASMIKIKALPATGTLWLDANGSGTLDAGEALAADAELAWADRGKIVFTPTTDWTGETTFTWSAKDLNDNLWDATPATVSIKVFNSQFSETGLEDANVIINDWVRGGSDAQIKLQTLPSNGVLFYDANGNGILNAGEALAAGAVISWTDATTAGKIKFIGDPDWHGTTSFLYKTGDGTTWGTPVYQSGITLTSVNDAPDGTDRDVTISQNLAHELGVEDFGFTDLKDNPENAFASVFITAVPSKGALKYSADGVTWSNVTAGQEIGVADVNLGRLTYTPVSGESGNSYVTLQFKVKDAGGISDGGVDTDPFANTMTINVKPNQAPTLSLTPLTPTFTEDGSEQTIVSGVNVTDTPDDIAPGSATVTITNYKAGDELHFTDASNKIQGSYVGGVLTLTAKTGETPTEAQFEAALQSVTFYSASQNPDPSDRSVEFAVFDDDGASSNVLTTTVHVVPVNDAPEATPQTVTAFEDVPLPITLTGADGDDGTQTLNFFIDSPPDNGELYATQANALARTNALTTGSITGNTVWYMAEPNDTTQTTFTFHVEDDGGTANGGDDTSDPAIVTVKVTPVDNVAPTATIAMSDPALTVGETSTVTITFSEAVTSFDNTDVTVENGTLGTLSSSDGGVTWTGTFTPTANIADTSNVISLAASYTDLAGNAGTTAVSGNYTIYTIQELAGIPREVAPLNLQGPEAGPLSTVGDLPDVASGGTTSIRTLQIVQGPGHSLFSATGHKANAPSSGVPSSLEPEAPIGQPTIALHELPDIAPTTVSGSMNQATGLYGYTENLTEGVVVVFNIDEMVWTDVLTASIATPGGVTNQVTGLYGYLEGVKAGKSLVFNMDEIDCLALCTPRAG